MGQLQGATRQLNRKRTSLTLRDQVGKFVTLSETGKLPAMVSFNRVLKSREGNLQSRVECWDSTVRAERDTWLVE